MTRDEFNKRNLIRLQECLAKIKELQEEVNEIVDALNYDLNFSSIEIEGKK